MTTVDLTGDMRALLAMDARFEGIATAAFDAEVWGGGYAGLVRLILGQLVSIEAADAMWANLVEALGEVAPTTIRKADPATLQRCGFTRRKAEYARAIGDAVDDGLDFGALDAETDAVIVDRLVSLPGVGPWTAECYLLFCLGRRDVFPAGDLALRVGWQEISGMAKAPTEALMRDQAEQWSPYRTSAAYLVWTSYLEKRGRLPPPGS